MDSFNDFCTWAGSQRRAAEMLGVSEATVSRWAARGCVPNVAAAEKVEQVTFGRFKWADMLRAPPELAQRIELASGGRYRRERFLWPDEASPAPQGGQGNG